MNANKLADEFQNRKDWKLINYIHWSEQSETMLRQQQDRIESLHGTYEINMDYINKLQAEIEALKVKNQALKIMNDGKNKIIEEYEHKYPDFFFMENDLMGKR